VDLAILASARKHEVADADMPHAYHHPVWVFETRRLVMLIGADPSGRLLEIGVGSAEGLDFVAPATSARAKSLR